MTEQEFLQLLSRFKQNRLSRSEATKFTEAVTSGRFDELVQDDVLQSMQKPARQQSGLLRVLGSARYRAAAAAILIGGLSSLFVFRAARNGGDKENAPAATAAIQPGGQKALLTLADGSVVELDSTGAMTIPGQGNANVQAAGGQLTYNDAGSESNAPIFNTLRTPRGGQFKIVLADGTKVWMNAGSALTYPTAFSSTERLVELSGEAYFEVEKDAAKPFRVKVKEMTVDVLGTDFNIMAYEEEAAVNTTLVDGAVKVSGNGVSELLKPGQQASLSRSGGLTVKEADVEEAVAWKNGLFIFQDADLQTVMRQLARWYDIEIEYEGRPADMKLNGAVFRNYSLSQVLTVLKATGLQFKMEANKLIIIS
ncbi:DUF4974 domain-containing protein [Chitinophaga lutea]|uniref:DUF4974 domain-containing protein n=1 Tax=Chitinophaga lutea TaxID=2488634 RepID=A0A3N4QPC7_9BACT|nr:FecR domain-containing protein [Chitinophaga lutea]RPE13514.1 DUF4974 domain-containing protein [Chitinophaga lutea]